MRKYRVNAATEIRLDYGIELGEGLALFPETAPLVPVVQAVNDDLEAAGDARTATRKPLVKARVQLRFADYRIDTTIRSASKAAEIADGGRRGPIHKAAFPAGLSVVVAPMGARQIAPTQALVDRIKKSKVAGIDAFRSEWVPKIEADLALLEAADKAVKDATKAYADAFGTEQSLRQEHYLTIDKVAGEVRSAFPGDRVKQDLVFPLVDDGEAAGPADAGNDTTAPAAPAPATPDPAAPANGP